MASANGLKERATYIKRIKDVIGPGAITRPTLRNNAIVT